MTNLRRDTPSNWLHKFIFKNALDLFRGIFVLNPFRLPPLMPYELNHIVAKYHFKRFATVMIAVISRPEKIHLFEINKANRPRVDEYIKPDALFEFAGQGILVISAHGEIIKINRVAETMFGYEPDELLNRKTELLLEESTDLPGELLQQQFLYPSKTRPLGTGLELTGRRKDGSSFAMEIGLNMIDSPTGKFAMAVIVDITQRRKQEDLLKKAHLSLQYYAHELQASNFELENFAYVSSHDLLEPIRKIRAFGNRLKAAETANITTQGNEYLDRVLHATDRMESLINDLLTFSRLSTKPQPYINVDLNLVLHEVMGDLEVSIENTNARIESGTLPVIEAEPTHMRQLFQNLISNAIKFRKETETPVIKINSIKNETDSARESYEISFADNGIGFDEKHKEKIFNIFQTLAGRKYEGSGIGLSVCRKIAIRHGGNIVAKSTVNIGSVFIVSLAAKQITPPQK